jgi:hypothetical protein
MPLFPDFSWGFFRVGRVLPLALDLVATSAPEKKVMEIT